MAVKVNNNLIETVALPVLAFRYHSTTENSPATSSEVVRSIAAHLFIFASVKDYAYLCTLYKLGLAILRTYGWNG